MTSLIDGDLETYWHSQWEGGEAPLPHWVVIDMQSPKKMSKIEIYRRAGNTDAKSVRVFVNDDSDPAGKGWMQITEGTFGEGDAVQLSIPASVATTKGRYLKILLPDSNRDPFISIAEVYVYGK